MKNSILKPVFHYGMTSAFNLFKNKIKTILILVVLFGYSSTYLFGQEKLLKFSLTGGVNLYSGNFTITPGILASVKLNDHFRVETGYKWDTFTESDGSQMLTITNKLNYHTIPIHLAYSWRKFDFVAGPSVHILNNGTLTLEEELSSGYGILYENGISSTYESSSKYTNIEDITGNYRKLFCSLNCGVRYNITSRFGVGISYNYGITNRYTNPIFNKPFHLANLNLHFRIFH
jgi:hypothetical protein